jgi:hypothetical protein
VPRPEFTEELKKRLLSNNQSAPGVLVMSPILGLGGIGKATLAAALAYDRDIQSHFKDGIFWVSLGNQPELFSRLHEWIQALGDY